MSKQLPLSLYVFIILFSCEKTHLFKGPLIGFKVIFFRSRRNPFSKNNNPPILNINLLLYMRFTKLDVNTNIPKQRFRRFPIQASISVIGQCASCSSSIRFALCGGTPGHTFLVLKIMGELSSVHDL